MLSGKPLRAWSRCSPPSWIPTSVAAIVMELELGEGGFVPAPKEYVSELAAFAREHGILFIADEIQTGFGRTGKLFASEHYDLVPDLIVTAKSLAGGFPLAAVTGRAEVMDAPQVGGLGGTYGGNPLGLRGCARRYRCHGSRGPGCPRRAYGGADPSRFCRWATEHEAIGDVRGLGAMMAVELVRDRGTKTPNPELTRPCSRQR